MTTLGSSPDGRNFFGRLALAALGALALLSPQGAWGAASPWRHSGDTAVRLISATDAAGDAAALDFGLEFAMNPGWKIYWRTPGDAGYPPSVDWRGAENVVGVDISWPLPERFTILGMESLGYADGVVLPLSVRPARAGEAVRLAGAVSWLACSTLCVPHEAEVALTLPAGLAAPAPEAGLIAAAAARSPGPSDALRVAEAVWRPGPDGPVVDVAVEADASLRDPQIIVEGPAQGYFPAPRRVLEDGGRRALFSARGQINPPDGAVEMPLMLTLWDGAGRMAEVPVTARRLPDGAAGLFPDTSLAAGLSGRILLIALLGGLILNIMPCVLPVLLLKLMAAVRAGGAGPARARKGFLAAGLGAMAVFVALGGLMAGLKTAGLAVGWGIQFQNPVFLAVVVLALALFAAAVVDALPLRLPARLADRLAGSGGGLWGDFATGGFAALLATPCSAPFVGTAAAVALGGPTGGVIPIFTVMGLGLALPWLAAALFPRAVAAVIPRPGPWMVWMKRALALILGLTAVWFLSVLMAAAGPVAAILSGVASAGAVLMLTARVRMRRPILSRSAGMASLALAAVAVAAPAFAPRLSAVVASERVAADWRPFDEVAIPGLLAAGKIVFVDVTADWCLTCKVNKLAVLDRGATRRWLAGEDVVAMRADWTRPDPAIAAYLRRHGRYGIPFNAVYGPDAPDGVPLPEILTPGAMRAAVAEAGGVWADAAP